VRLVPIITVLVISGKSLFSLDPTLAVSQYLRTSWTQEEGVDVPAVQAVAQGPDGYLWLGTSTGLIRFDGMRFFHWEPRAGEKLPSNDIRFLIASPAQGLWIGTAKGVSRLFGGSLTGYPDADRWLGGPAVTMMEDRLGRLWMRGPRSGGGLGALLRDGSFQVYGPADGLPAAGVRTIFEDRLHNLWLGTSSGVCRWAPGSPAACLNIPHVSAFSLIEDMHGDLLIGDDISKSMLQLSNGKLEAVIDRVGNASLIPRAMLRDHDGNVWIGTAGQGLLRLREGRLERFTRRNGLSSDVIGALTEDREGNLWVGTARGVDRLRDPKVVHLGTSEGLSSDLVTTVYANQGAVWIGTSGGGLNRVVGGRITQFLMDSGLPSTTVISLSADGGGRLWAGTSAGLAYFSGSRFIQVRSTGGRPLERVFAISGDRTGGITLADANQGLFTVRNGVARPLSIPGLPTERIYQLQFDRDGVLWIGYYAGGMAALSGTSARVYTVRDGLGEGPVRAIYQDRTGSIWAGTGTGLSRFHNGTWTTWTTRHGLPAGGVQGIVEDDRHDALWLVTASGLVRLPLADLNTSNGPGSNAAAKPLNLRLFGRNDGLRLAGSGNMLNSRVMKSDDGRIWLCTEDGVAIVDPIRMRSNAVPPPVVIEQVVVDGKTLDVNSPSGIAFQGSQLQIAYTALSLMAPERIRFKYRLDGLDPDWIDAETRRSVDYVRLPPGHYRFHVIACNNDGVWNTSGAVLALRVPPHFYQTTWFIALCVVLVASVAWGADQIRVRGVVSRFQLIAQERARLTRELHDSLLQGFVGVVYQLEAVARQFDTAPEASKQRLERAIDQADQALLEARRTILSMRLPALEHSTLPEALSAIAARLTEGTSVVFRLDVKGRVRQLPYDAQANVYLIGREAIANSVSHARASRILAALAYSEKELRLTVQDDGSGFDPQAAIAKNDHWGMAGMRERAETIGASFVLDTSPGRGTKIEVVFRRKG
jgi:signal transduction histidine kinase/ligand-binding sensor domain-containing protein